MEKGGCSRCAIASMVEMEEFSDECVVGRAGFAVRHIMIKIRIKRFMLNAA